MRTHPLLIEWFRRIVLSQQGHYNASAYFERLNYWLGIPVVILSAFVGTAVFATLEKNVDARLRILIGLISVLAAVLASLQTFFRFADRSEIHRDFGGRYGALRREIEQIIAFPPPTEDELRQPLTDLRQRLDTLGTEAPEIPRWAWKQAEQRFHNKFQASHPLVDGLPKDEGTKAPAA